LQMRGDDALVISVIRAMAAELGRVPRARDLPRSVYSAAVQSFGSLRAACVAAGLPAESFRARPGRRWTRDQVVAAIADLARELGRVPKASDLRRPMPGCPSLATVVRVCGSLGAALEAAGLGYTPGRPERGRRWDREACAEALREVSRLMGGRKPTARDLQAAKRAGLAVPCPETCRRLFGSFARALAEAGFDGVTRRKVGGGGIEGAVVYGVGGGAGGVRVG